VSAEAPFLHHEINVSAHDNCDDYVNNYVQLQNGRVPNFSSKGIVFGHINICSLIGKIDEFRHLCNDTFDVICVNETLCDQSIVDNELHLPGFQILRRDRTRNGGGVALFCRDSFNFKRRDDLSDNSIECIWAEITPPHRSPILVCAIYNPNGKDAEFSEKLSNMLSNVSMVENEIIVLGDFNCDYSPNVTTKEVNDLKFSTEMYQLQQLICLPTRVTPSTKTIIDLFYTTKPELYCESGVIQTSLSDHYMIYAIRQCKPAKDQHRSIDYRCFKSFNEEKFVDDLFCVPWNVIEKVGNVNNALNLWYGMFQRVVDKHIPKKCKRVKVAPAPWLTRNVKKLMSKRDYLHRKALKSNDNSDWDNYKKCRNLVTKTIRDEKQTYCRQNVSDNIGNSKKMWNALQNVLPQKTSPSPSSITIDDRVCTSDNDIADGFNEHFTGIAAKLVENAGSSNYDLSNVNCVPSVNDSKHVLNLPSVSIDFVSKEIDLMNEKKATGLDDVGSKILKLAKPAIVSSLVYIMNLSLRTGVFPDLWKVAKIIPLHKGGDMSINNFRPIAILPVLSKIIERAVHKHLYDYLNEHKLLNENQSGFRPSHSTDTCLLNMVNQWTSSMNSGNMIGVAFIDLRKAFDTVSHRLLLDKLHDLGASNTSIKWFHSYLFCRTQRVNFKNSLSSSRPVTTGVPQGSILGPLFFLIFINSMSNVVSHGQISMYADDTTLSVSGNDAQDISHKLTSDLESIMKWLNVNDLVLNTDKTNVMLIGTAARLRTVDEKDFSVFVNGKLLERVRKAKCLGVTIDDQLKWHDQVNSVVQKVFCKLGLLRRLKPSLDCDILNIVFKAFVQPIFDYCSLSWYGRFKEDIVKLDKVHKRCARVILGVNYLTPSELMFNTLGWERLETRSDYFKSLMMFKSLNGLAPDYLANMFTLLSATHDVNTRQAAAGQLALPPTENGHDIECFKSSFSYSGVQLWNNLDIDLRNSNNVQSFKKQFKRSYFRRF